MENEKNEVKKVDFLTKNEVLVYKLTKNEALERLKTENISESEQMLNKWCRDGDIDAVRIAKGAPKDRGLRISEKSLNAFILTKSGNVSGLLDEIEDLKRKLKDAKKEIKELKENGLRKPRKSSVNLTQSYQLGNELHFKMNRAKHKATFDDDQLVKIEKNTRTGYVDVTELLSEEKKEAIIEKKKDKRK
jgi:hypothetical protein